ncbi:MAG: L-2-amino-thiazoline-4-carboxylic acid hydrolase [Planctomycetota bacterium]|jgi:hypothetical protein
MRLGKDNSSSLYFVKRRPRLLRRFDKAARYFVTVLESHMCGEYSNEVVAEIREEFSHLIPAIPYITGNKFILMISIECAQYIALYRVLQKRGVSTQECGRMVVLIAEERLKSVPGFVLRLLGWCMHTPIGRRWIRKTYVESCDKPDSAYTVRAEFVPGSGKEFDFGVDIYECGLCRYFHDQNADDIMPYVCLIDQVQARAMKVGVRRTETLASGGSKCDFRWKKGWQVENPWPPEWIGGN